VTKKLLIHHHAPAFVDAAGIHVPSFIGCWVKALSQYYEHVGLLLATTPSKLATQDTLVNEPNVSIHPLPLGGKRWDYFQRKNTIAKICRDVSGGYDVLLVRGITPRQWTVWKNCHTPKKAFLLVGSLVENRPKFGWRSAAWLTWLLRHLRHWEMARIAHSGGVLLVNSPGLAQEIKLLWGKEAHFISTNTLQKNHVRPLTFREVPQPAGGRVCRLLFCGRVVQDKGIEELIQTLGLLKGVADMDFRLTVVGAISPAYKVVLAQLATRCGVASCIDWRGFVPFGEPLFEYYRAADFMILPSYHEGFPHGIWEAAVSSVPVLTTKVGGIPGLVDDTMVSFLQLRSSQDIVDNVLFLCQNKAVRWAKVKNLYLFSMHHTVESGAKNLSSLL
jgi:glycosyltransferase involved in cell wall biosynthesis